jgi:hypothetical protein
MMLEDLMIHGSLPHSIPTRPKRRSRSIRSFRQLQELPPPPLPTDDQGRGAWDEDIQFYKEDQRRRAEAGETDGPARRRVFRIEDDTPIVPRAAAEYVWEEASLWLREPFAPRWKVELVERANLAYQHNPGFRRLLRKPGVAGREWLIAFMRHWLVALLASRCPHLRDRLPRFYASGQDLRPG